MIKDKKLHIMKAIIIAVKTSKIIFQKTVWSLILKTIQIFKNYLTIKNR